VTLADADPAVGDPIEVVGFPGGGQLTSSTGTVLGFEEDPLDANTGQVIITDAVAEPGSSGSPMYDASGQVVGVVYAAAEDGSRSLAVPVSTLRRLLADPDATDDVPPCG
jgi:S1-C subfamily serine protease